MTNICYYYYYYYYFHIELHWCMRVYVFVRSCTHLHYGHTMDTQPGHSRWRYTGWLSVVRKAIVYFLRLLAPFSKYAICIAAYWSVIYGHCQPVIGVHYKNKLSTLMAGPLPLPMNNVFSFLTEMTSSSRKVEISFLIDVFLKSGKSTRSLPSNANVDKEDINGRPASKLIRFIDR